MVLRDLQSSVNTTLILNPAVYTASQPSRDLDLKGYGYVTFVALIGTPGDTWDSSNYAELEVQDSEDNLSWSACANAVLQTTVTGTTTGTFAKLSAATHGVQVKKTTYRGSKRFVRCYLRLTGTHSTGTVFGIAAFRYGARYLPVAEGGASASPSRSPSASRSPSSSASASTSPSASRSPSSSQSPSASRSPSVSASASPSA